MNNSIEFLRSHSVVEIVDDSRKAFAGDCILNQVEAMVLEEISHQVSALTVCDAMRLEPGVYSALCDMVYGE